jgi:hypothetical protein
MNKKNRLTTAPQVRKKRSVRSRELAATDEMEGHSFSTYLLSSGRPRDAIVSTLPREPEVSFR